MIKKTSDAGKNLIKSFEGKHLSAYQDSVGIWTIAFGTIKYPNGIAVKKGDKCTDAQADQYFNNDLIKFENSVNTLVKVPLTQNRFDALISFTYNLGGSALASSTLLKKLNAKDYKGAAAEFPKWNKAGGKVVSGLTKRRDAEMELFLK
jgi:GH24 family phage-related lysozyme (muramidase)